MTNQYCRHGYDIIRKKEIVEYIEFDNTEDSVYINDVISSLIDEIVVYFSSTQIIDSIEKYKNSDCKIELKKRFEQLSDLRVILYDDSNKLNEVLNDSNTDNLIKQSSHVVGIDLNGGLPYLSDIEGLSVSVLLNNENNSIKLFLVDILIDIFVFYFVLDLLGDSFKNQYRPNSNHNKKKFSEEKYKFVSNIIERENNYYEFDLNCFKNPNIQYFPLSSVYRKDEKSYYNVEYFISYLELFIRTYNLPNDEKYIYCKIINFYNETKNGNILFGTSRLSQKKIIKIISMVFSNKKDKDL